MTDLEKTTKAIFVLTEKIDLLERDLSLAQYYFEQAKKKCEEDDARIARLEAELEAARAGKEPSDEIKKGDTVACGKPRPARLPNFHKETRPAAEKAEEIR